MAKEKFEARRLTGNVRVTCKYEDGTQRIWEEDKEVVVSRIIQIVNAYSTEGYTLTLRQLHYQLVARNWIVNHDSAYKKLGDILDDCRYCGAIDWGAVEDRGRVPYIPYSLKDATHAMQDAIDTFRINRQEGQNNCVELWTEKDALSGILQRTTIKYHIQLVVNKGYTSSSAIYRSYRRALEAIKAGRKMTILYFGDHDPSGLDMVRDIRERLLFMLSKGGSLMYDDDFVKGILEWWNEEQHDIYDLVREEYAPEKILKLLNEDNEDYADLFEAARIRWYLQEKDLFRVVPIGLTKEQIREFNLPPNPTKLTDSRAADYIRHHGRTCWEVDALDPQTLTRIVEENVTNEIDLDKYHAALEREDAEQTKLQAFYDKLKDDEAE